MTSKEIKMLESFMLSHIQNKGDDKSQINCDSNVAKSPLTNKNHKRVHDDSNLLRPINDKQHGDVNNRLYSFDNNRSIDKTARTVNNGEGHGYYGPSKPKFCAPSPMVRDHNNTNGRNSYSSNDQYNNGRGGYSTCNNV